MCVCVCDCVCVCVCVCVCLFYISASPYSNFYFCLYYLVKNFNNRHYNNQYWTVLQL